MFPTKDKTIDPGPLPFPLRAVPWDPVLKKGAAGRPACTHSRAPGGSCRAPSRTENAHQHSPSAAEWGPSMEKSPTQTPPVHFREPPADILTPSEPSKPGREGFLDEEACLAALLQPKGSGSRPRKQNHPKLALGREHDAQTSEDPQGENLKTQKVLLTKKMPHVVNIFSVLPQVGCSCFVFPGVGGAGTLPVSTCGSAGGPGLPGWEVMESQGSRHEHLVILYETLPRLLPTAHQSSFKLLTCVTAIVQQQAGVAGILRRMGPPRI